MIGENRLSYLLREALLKRGVKNLLDFTNFVAKKGFLLVSNNSLSSANLQKALGKKDREFLKSNNISKNKFYNIVVGIIKKEVSDQKKAQPLETEKKQGISINNSFVHFGHGDNVKGDKKISNKGETFLEKFFWYGILALIVGISAIIISKQLGY